MRAMRLFGAAALLACLCAEAQETAKRYRIVGVVTNSSTGEAVAGATMSLSSSGTTPGTNSSDNMRTVQTDADGRFALEPVPAGKYTLRATRRGYLTEAFNQHEGFSSAIVTGEGQDTEHIAFHLDPGATLRCVVTDDAGEPVEGAQVLLARKANADGLGERMQPAGGGRTDDTGVFEYWGLMPGTYFLAVHTTPWYATHMAQSQQNNMDEESRASMAALDVAYPVTYYDGATEESAAAPIAVKSGEQAEADVALHAVPALHLTLPAAGPRDGRQQPMAMMRQSILGNEQFGMLGGQASVSKDGTMELFGVAPGHYTVMEGNPPRETEVDATGSQALDLSRGVTMFEVTIKPRMADGTQVPRFMGLSLLSESSGRRISGGMNEKGELHAQGVPAGEWSVEINGGTGALAVISIQAGTAAPRTESRIEVKDHNLEFNVVLAQAKTSVEGFAAKNGKNEAGVMIVLVPKNPDGHLAEFRRDQTDSDGSFSLQGVVPGAYTVVAIEDGWELEWAKSEVIGRYLKDGLAVTVPLNAPAVMKLGKLVAVQEK
jgi:hypothetical protein